MIAAELQIAIGAPVGGHSCVMPRRRPRMHELSSQERKARSLRQNEHACILDGRGLGHCWVIVVYVLGSGATLELADARGYRCRNKGNVVVRCGDYRPVRAKDGRWVFRSSRFVPEALLAFWKV
eukprot:s9063_g4.t1